jgi:hypothetical protein
MAITTMGQPKKSRILFFGCPMDKFSYDTIRFIYAINLESLLETLFLELTAYTYV